LAILGYMAHIDGDGGGSGSSSCRQAFSPRLITARCSPRLCPLILVYSDSLVRDKRDLHMHPSTVYDHTTPLPTPTLCTHFHTDARTAGHLPAARWDTVHAHTHNAAIIERERLLNEKKNRQDI